MLTLIIHVAGYAGICVWWKQHPTSENLCWFYCHLDSFYGYLVNPRKVAAVYHQRHMRMQSQYKCTHKCSCCLHYEQWLKSYFHHFSYSGGTHGTIFKVYWTNVYLCCNIKKLVCNVADPDSQRTLRSGTQIWSKPHASITLFCECHNMCLLPLLFTTLAWKMVHLQGPFIFRNVKVHNTTILYYVCAFQTEKKSNIHPKKISR